MYSFYLVLMIYMTNYSIIMFLVNLLDQHNIYETSVRIVSTRPCSPAEDKRLDDHIY